MILFFIFLFTKFSGIISEETCFDDVCYYFNELADSKILTYDEALTECENKNHKLAVISNRVHQDRLQNFSHSNGYNDEFYIGLKYKKNEIFMWENEADFVPDLNWSDDISISSDISCGFMTKSGTVSLDSCTTKRNFICSNSTTIKPKTEDSLTGFCPKGYSRFLNFCYRMNLRCIDKAYTWEEARSQCATWNGTLVVAESFAEQEFLTALLTMSPKPVWTGLVNLRLSPAISLWVNNYTGLMPRFPARFKTGEPNGHSRQEHCLMVYNRLANLGYYNDEQCNKSMNLVCKAPLIQGIPKEDSIVLTPHPLFKKGKCKDNYFEFNDTCYFIKDLKKPYSESEAYCENKVLFVYNDIHIAFIRSLMSFIGVNDTWLSILDPITKKLNGAFWLLKETDSESVFHAEKDKCYYMSTERGLGTAKSCTDTNRSTSCYYNLPTHEDSTEDLSCPLPWTKVGTKCIRVTDDYFDFNDSMNECVNLNGKIATVKSMKEMQAIEPLIHTDAWIGISGPSYLKNSWVDGSTIEYCLFRHTSDLITTIRKNPSEICFVVRDKKSEMDDKSCRDLNPAICEAPVTRNKCPSDLRIHVDGDCYGSFNNKLTWSKAEEFCRTKGGHLASFHNMPQEHNVFVEVSTSEEYWIGLKMYDNNAKWIDGSLLNYQRNYIGMNNFNCFSSQKTNYRQFVNSLWFKENCQIEKNFICKISNKTRSATPNKKEPDFSKLFCLAGFLRFRNSCFKVMNDNLTWSDADKSCMTFKSPNATARLASFQSDDEFAYVLSQMRDLHRPSWIGLYREEKFGQLVWVDEKPLTFIRSLEPSNFSPLLPGNVTAVFLSGNPFQNGRWMSLSKITNLPYVCRIDPWETVDRTKDISQAKPCPPSYVEYNHNCYLYNEADLTFKEASQYCKSINSDLIVIEDSFEEHFVQSLLSSRYGHNGLTWLGISIQASSDMMMVWKSVADKPIYYTHWKKVLRFRNNQIYLGDNPKTEINGCYVYNHTSVELSSDVDLSDFINNNMQNFYCDAKLPSICKKAATPRKRIIDHASITCASSRNGTSFNLDVTETKFKRPCIRWDLVKQPNTFLFHYETILSSSVPFNKDGYLSYSLNRCSEFKIGFKDGSYSCYTYENGKYSLEECEMERCRYTHPSISPSPRRKDSPKNSVFLIIFLMIVMILLVSFVFLCRQRILSNYRLRSILAHVLGRYQPGWLVDSRRPPPSVNGGTGFVNPVYTPLESKY